MLLHIVKTSLKPDVKKIGNFIEIPVSARKITIKSFSKILQPYKKVHSLNVIFRDLSFKTKRSRRNPSSLILTAEEKLTEHVSQVACGSFFFFDAHYRACDKADGLLFALFRRFLSLSVCLREIQPQTLRTCDTSLPKPQSESGWSQRRSAICRVVGSGSWEQSLPVRAACVNDWQQPGAALRRLYETWEHGEFVSGSWMYIYMLWFFSSTNPALLPGLTALYCAVVMKTPSSVWCAGAASVLL